MMCIMPAESLAPHPARLHLVLSIVAVSVCCGSAVAQVPHPLVEEGTTPRGSSSDEQRTAAKIELPVGTELKTRFIEMERRFNGESQIIGEEHVFRAALASDFAPSLLGDLVPKGTVVYGYAKRIGQSQLEVYYEGRPFEDGFERRNTRITTNKVQVPYVSETLMAPSTTMTHHLVVEAQSWPRNYFSHEYARRPLTPSEVELWRRHHVIREKEEKEEAHMEALARSERERQAHVAARREQEKQTEAAERERLHLARSARLEASQVEAEHRAQQAAQEERIRQGEAEERRARETNRVIWIDRLPFIAGGLHGLVGLLASLFVWQRIRDGSWPTQQTRLVFQKLHWTRFYVISIPAAIVAAFLAAALLGPSAEGQAWIGWRWLIGATAGLVLAFIGQYLTAHLHIFLPTSGKRPGVRGKEPAEPRQSAPPLTSDPGISDDW